MKHPVFNDEKELPLSDLVENGGFTAIFRTIGCVGDSLASGEFETCDADGTCHYIDKFEYSWGQFIARMTGSKVYNFSRGGMTAKWYVDSFAEENGYWDEDKKCQAYILALGVNDIIYQDTPLGDGDKASLDEWENNDDTFAGKYATIIARLKKINPEAKFFLMTMPRINGEAEDKANLRRAHAELLKNYAARLKFGFVLDFNTYAPLIDKEFEKNYFLRGHLNPMGYRYFALMISSYIDYIIRHDPDKFKLVGLGG
jgi:lysophospholipase L1-like esterase